MKLYIAEDEAPARERLLEALRRVAPHAVVLGHTHTVQGLRQWLAANPWPDVLLLDIQLADGLSLELFEGADAPQLPVIFTTAFDEYALAAFNALAVGYLLKPVDEALLAKALAKVQALHQAFGPEQAAALRARWAVPAPASPNPPRRRWLGRLGNAFVAVPADEVACFVSIDKLTYLITGTGQRLQLDEPLAEVEAQAEPQAFFRINRQVIVAASAVRRFWSAGKGKLALELAVPSAPAQGSPWLVSAERAPAFKAWLAR
jgi:DNA-binding LytR/AlgR family response regulator